MKNALIKILGGKIKADFDNELSIAINNERRHLFRKGDLVFINHNLYDPRVKYFLLESYNGGTCWYVSRDSNSKERRELSNGVHIKDLTFDEIQTCRCCGKKLV
jgi:hypothetical protein